MGQSYRSDKWQRLASARIGRKLAKSRKGAHPLSHVDPDKCYEWMRSDCASYDAARQAREDGLISTITQISSAALLAIPGLIFGANQDFPEFDAAPLLYAGIFTFLTSLILSMVEQYLSAKAYRRQTKIAQDYYLLQSDKRSDEKFVAWVRRCRNSACITFGVAVAISTAALMMLERDFDGTPAASTSAPPSTTATATATATAASAHVHSRR